MMTNYLNYMTIIAGLNHKLTIYFQGVKFRLSLCGNKINEDQ